METTWGQKGDKMETKWRQKWRQNGDKMEGWRPGWARPGAGGNKNAFWEKNIAKSDGVLLQNGVCANIA